MIRHWVSAGFLLLLAISAPHARAGEPVELELVLAVDSSTSVDAAEYRLQSQGFADAFRDPAVKAAIRSLGPDGMAVSVIHWAGRGRQKIALDWTRVAGDADADLVASIIASLPRSIDGFTDISGAIRKATSHILENNYDGRRMTIDVSGDGRSDDISPRFARDDAVAQGIVINGLVIYTEEYDLGKLADVALLEHYRNDVTGGQGSFVEEAADFSDFARAMRRKLVREIMGPSFVGPPIPDDDARAAAALLDGGRESRL